MGVLKCSVNSCGRKTSEKDIAFFFFPSLTLTQRHNAWIRACHRDKDWKPSKHSIVCQSHFDSLDFLLYDTTTKKKRLKKDAVPHLNLDPTARLFHDDIFPSTNKLVIQPPNRDVTTGETSTTGTIGTTVVTPKLSDTLFQPEVVDSGHTKNFTVDTCPPKHWLNKMRLPKTCFVCDKKTDWMCGAPMCMKSYCFSPCFSKHQEILAKHDFSNQYYDNVEHDEIKISHENLLGMFL